MPAPPAKGRIGGWANTDCMLAWAGALILGLAGPVCFGGLDLD